MASTPTKASKFTTLTMGKVEIPVTLFSAHEKPGKLEKFDTAGPNGGVLKAREVAKPTPVEEPSESQDQPVHSDPLADGPIAAVEAAPLLEGHYNRQVEGQYGRELVEDGTGVVVLPQDVRRGVRREDGSFVDCTEQLEQIEERTQLEKMDVVAFVDVTRVPRARVVGAYYVGVQAPEGAQSLRLVYEALKRSRRAAVVKLTKSSRQSLGIVGWHGDALMLYELMWAEDFRPAPPRATVIQKAAVSESQVDMACELISAMSDGIDALDSLRDDALALRQELRARAEAGELAEVVDAEVVDADDDLMGQLEASLQAVA